MVECLNEIMDTLVPVCLCVGGGWCAVCVYNPSSHLFTPHPPPLLPPSSTTLFTQTQQLQELPEVTGTLVVRATVAPDGRIPEADVRFLTDTLVLRPWSMSDDEPMATRAAVRAGVVRQLCGYKFPAAAQGSTELTLPLAF